MCWCVSGGRQGKGKKKKKKNRGRDLFTPHRSRTLVAASVLFRPLQIPYFCRFRTFANIADSVLLLRIPSPCDPYPCRFRILTLAGSVLLLQIPCSCDPCRIRTLADSVLLRLLQILYSCRFRILAWFGSNTRRPHANQRQGPSPRGKNEKQERPRPRPKPPPFLSEHLEATQGNRSNTPSTMTKPTRRKDERHEHSDPGRDVFLASPLARRLLLQLHWRCLGLSLLVQPRPGR